MSKYHSLFAAVSLIAGATFNPAFAVDLSGAGDSGTDSMALSMNVVDACSFAVSAIDFGDQGLLTTATSSDGSLGITCSDGTAFTVAFETGQTMTDGTTTVPYHLALIGTPTLVGTGVEQAIGIRSTFDQNVAPAAGNYTDTTDVTVAIAN